MNDDMPAGGQDLPSEQPYAAPFEDPMLPQTIEVPVGNAMPPSQVQNLPMLDTTVAAGETIDATEAAHARSMLAEGMHFVGNAILRGPFSVAGEVDGNLSQAAGIQVSVVVTESGRVKGDITAHKISVMGHTDGILDSGQGEVALHDTASVHGLVRYGRIQVNGADLNATLERVAPPKNPNA
ncbi:MAG: polymer-forming cytoskeletal protein [Burkholderiaceae bacterium]